MDQSPYAGLPKPMAWYLRLTDGLNLIIAVAAGVILCAMSIAVFGSVLSRFIANISLSWVEEAATFGIAWVVTLGTALAVRGGDLTSVEVVAMRLKRQTNRRLKMAICLIAVVYFLFVMYSGWRMAGIARMQSSPTIPWLSMYWVYLAVPVGAVCMFVNIIARFLELALQRREK
ncbi:MAG: TRAP transporter small permease [Planctomycetes bacterium]|nr:TRAP transporter small permease [Planctomycetota bacterium]